MDVVETLAGKADPFRSWNPGDLCDEQNGNSSYKVSGADTFVRSTWLKRSCGVGAAASQSSQSGTPSSESFHVPRHQSKLIPILLSPTRAGGKEFRAVCEEGGNPWGLQSKVRPRWVWV